MHNPFATERIILETGLSVVECQRRLSSELREMQRPWPGDDRSSAFGWCTGGRFWLWRLRWVGGRIPFGSASFTAGARGRFQATGAGTRIEVRIGLLPVFAGAVLFMGAGFLFAFFFTCWMLLTDEAARTPPPTALAWCFVGFALLLMLAFPVSLFYVRWVDPRDVRFLKTFLSSTLAAR
jgi:hypothetical protein